MSIPPEHASVVGTYLSTHAGPGVSECGGCLVLPRALVQRLPLQMQQQVVSVLHQVQHAMTVESWPQYHVVPSRQAPVAELTEAELTDIGVTAELDPAGEVVYCDIATGRVLSEDELNRTVQISAGSSPAQR